MTTISALHEIGMDVSHLDDKMELGTSPYPHVDDIDFDFDPIREQSVDRSMADDTDVTANVTDFIQADLDNAYHDDSMLDEETMQPDNGNGNDLEDLHMEPYDQDEEILYDEEDAGSVNMAEEHAHEHLGEAIVHIANDSLEADIDHTSIEKESIKENGDNITNTISQPNQPDGFQSDPTTNSEAQGGPHIKNGLVPAATEIVDFANHENADQPQDFTQPLPKAIKDDSSTQQQVDIQDQQDELDQQTAIIAPQIVVAPEEGVVTETSRPEEHDTDESTQPLHPVTVLYLGQEMSLFPPMMDDVSVTFFLPESNLAYEPMEKLLTSCRELLGDTLEHDDELVLDIPALGLHICEDSKYASQITLSQVIQVYLKLSHNENIDNIEALFCNLSSRVCLASQYAYLAGSASEGKTYSEIAADYIDSPEHEDGLQERPDNDVINQVEELPKETTVDVEDAVEALDSETGDPGLSESSLQARDEKIDKTGEQQTDLTDIETNVTHTSDKTQEDTASVEFHAIQQVNVNEAQTSPPRDVSLESSAERIELQYDDQPLKSNDGFHPHETGDVTEYEDHESVSSHTVDGDPTEQLTEQDPSTSDHVDNDDGHEIQEDHAQQPEEEIEDITSGLFDEDPEVDEVVPTNEGHIGIPETEPTTEVLKNNAITQADLDVPNEADADALVFDEVDTVESDDNYNNEDESELLLLGDEATTDLPVTPSKQNGSKRKALDVDEDLDFLDFSTPEPKRNRAS